MLLRLLSYGALGLAVLNVGENLGLVEKNRYLTFLPRWESGWDVSGNPTAREWIATASRHLKSAGKEASPGASEIAGKFTDYVVEKNQRTTGS